MTRKAGDAITSALFFVGDLVSGLLPLSFADWLEGKREARNHDGRNWSPPR